MLPQNPNVSPASQRPTLPEHHHCLSVWQTACFSPLKPYESVTRQYECLGVRFAHAIALRPSNPQFMAPSDHAANHAAHKRAHEVAIMPITGQNKITLHLRRSILQVQLQVIGSQPVTLSTLDGAGHCVAQGQLHRVAQAQGVAGLAWQQHLMISTHSVRTVHIGSKSPFVIHGLQVLHKDRASR
ncbi:MAG: hypothetical protein O2890_04270 [Cyanobacteria bacterium]|nr:hypothetical protein [Cyanobacteriota bacterium]MDA0865622.1 hypothetical protein [Cyanobacteriota bacterium]